MEKRTDRASLKANRSWDHEVETETHHGGDSVCASWVNPSPMSPLIGAEIKPASVVVTTAILQE